MTRLQQAQHEIQNAGGGFPLLGGPRALNPARPRSVSQVQHEVKRKDDPRSGRWPPETPWIATDRDSALFEGACAGRVTGNFRPKPPTREPRKSTAGGRVSKSSFFNQRGGGGRRRGASSDAYHV